MEAIDTEIRKGFSRYRILAVILLLVIIHIIGIIGLHSEHYRLCFEQVAWLDMLVSFLLVVALYRSWPAKHTVFLSLALGISLTCEIIGVQLGLLFGDYHYGLIGGPWLLGVPLVIGLNWVFLTICTGTLSAMLFQKILPRIVVATILMVSIDCLLERFAIEHHLWVWEHYNAPPTFNFITWGIVSFALQCLFISLWRNHENIVTIIYLGVLVSFLLVDWAFDKKAIHICILSSPYHLIDFDNAPDSLV